ncbi:hypothetical protein [Clostridium sp.]|uniref:hypothetical protein n=1 Tax=Clostridium sp. TaxID=1506 RepID=UPI003D6CE6D4
MTENEQNEMYGGNLVEKLETIGWINLVCSVFVALYIWVKFGQVDVGLYDKEINPVGVVAGISFIVTGIIVLIIMQSISHILDNSIEVRNKIEENPKEINKVIVAETVKENHDYKVKNEIVKEPKINEIKIQEQIGENPITYAEDLGYTWKCVCGNINDDSQESCKHCKSNKDYILSNFSKYNV